MNLAPAGPLALAIVGLLMGMRHATDPDHVIAVTTIVSRQRNLLTAGRIGVVWGTGHTLTVLAVGALIIFFKISIPTRVGLAMEFAVAIVLILLGLNSTAGLLRRFVKRLRGSAAPAARPLTVHSHVHRHGLRRHRHPHVHRRAEERANLDTGADCHEHALDNDEALFPAVRRPLLRSFSVGLVHGLAGSAAIALLVLSAIPDPLWATLYLMVFCLGTIIGMGLITAMIAAPFVVATERLAWLHQSFVASSGLLSFSFGLCLAYQLGVIDSLFGAVPIWTPH